MQRVKFTTTLDPEVVKYLKIRAIEENTDANQIIEQVFQKEMKMKTWTLYRNNESDVELKGETLDEAIVSHFKTIAAAAKLGNAAGYSLERVEVAYERGILGGKGGAVVTITASGLPLAHKTAGPSKTYTVWIQGATPEDCPELHEISIKGQ